MPSKSILKQLAPLRDPMADQYSGEWVDDLGEMEAIRDGLQADHRPERDRERARGYNSHAHSPAERKTEATGCPSILNPATRRQDHFPATT